MNAKKTSSMSEQKRQFAELGSFGSFFPIKLNGQSDLEAIL